MSAKILKALSEDPQLEKEIGCMTGILQIFDRHQAITGRRYGHRRLVSGARSLPTSSCGSPRFEGSGPTAFTSFTDERLSLDSSGSQKASDAVEARSSSYENGEHSFSKDVPRVSAEMKLEPGRGSLDSKDAPRLSFYIKETPRSFTETARDPPRNSFAGLTAKDGLMKPGPSLKDQPRASYDSREHGRPSMDIREVVRASFNRDPARMSVDGHEAARVSVDVRESARASSVSRQDTPKMSFDGREPVRAAGERKESPRASNVKSFKDPARVSLDGKEAARSSMDFKESLKALSGKYSRDAGRLSVDGRDAPRASLDLKEPPRLSVAKEGPRFSLDGRDAPRYSLDSRTSQRNREPPRLSADGRDAPRHSLDQRDLLLASLQLRETSSGFLQSRDFGRSSVDSRSSRTSSDSFNTRDVQLASFNDAQRGSAEGKKALKPPGSSESGYQGSTDVKRRVPNVVARLMGLEELPDPAPLPQQRPPPIATSVKKPSTEAKLLQELLQYKPLEQSQTKQVIEPKPFSQRPSKVQEDFFSSSANKSFGSRKLSDSEYPVKQALGAKQDFVQPSSRVVDSVPDSFLAYKRGQETGVAGWRSHDSGSNFSGKFHPSASRNFTEAMPPAPKQQDVREISQFKYAQLQKQFPEAILTVLKHSEEVKKQQQSSDTLLGELEQRLQQLRVKNSQQERKTLRQILEAMQLKGLLHPPRMESDRQAEPMQTKAPSHNYYSGYYSKHESPYNGDQSPRMKSIQDMKAIQDMRAYQQMRDSQDNMIELSIDAGKAIPQYGKSGNSGLLSTEASIVVMKPVTKQQGVSKPKGGQNASVSSRGVRTSNSVKASAPSGSLKSVRGHQGLAPIAAPREPISKFNAEETMTFRKRRERLNGTGAPKAVQQPPSAVEPRQVLKGGKPPAGAPASKGRAAPVKDAASVRQQSAVSKSTTSSSVKAAENGRKLKASTTQSQRSQSMRDPEAASRRSVDAEPRKVLRRCSSDVGTQSSGPAVEGGGRSSYVPSPESPRLRVPGKTSERARQSGSLSDSEAAASRRASVGSRDLSFSRVADQSASPSSRQPLVVETGSLQAKTGEQLLVGTKSSPTTRKGMVQQQSVGSSPSKNENLKEVARASSIRSNVEEATDHCCDIRSLEDLASTLPYPEISVDKYEQEYSQSVNSLTGGAYSAITSVLLNQGDVKYLGEAIAEGAEQPSPVSVLDTPFHDEEHSPRAVNKSIVSLKDAQLTLRLEALANELSWEEQHPADLLPQERVVAAVPDHARPSMTTTEFTPSPPAPESKVPSPVPDLMLDIPIAEDKQLEGSKAVEMAYVRDVLNSSGLTDEKELILSWHSPSFAMDPELFDRWEEKRRLRGEKRDAKGHFDEAFRIEMLRKSEQEVMDRRLLFDSVNDIVAKKLHPYLHPQPWVTTPSPALLRKPPTGQRLVQEVWNELQQLPCPPSEDVCDTLYTMLQKDLAHKSEKWLDYSTEVGELGVELERMIFKELMEEAVMEWSTNTSRPPRTSQQCL